MQSPRQRTFDRQNTICHYVKSQQKTIRALTLGSTVIQPFSLEGTGNKHKQQQEGVCAGEETYLKCVFTDYDLEVPKKAKRQFNSLPLSPEVKAIYSTSVLVCWFMYVRMLVSPRRVQTPSEKS